MLRLVEELCNLNSGTFNLAGLDQVKQRLVEEFKSLDGEINILDSNPMSIVDEAGVEVEQQLGQMIHVSKWPQAKKRVLLCIHMDTVYPVEHAFQKCKTLDSGHINGPGVADAKGGDWLGSFTQRR